MSREDGKLPTNLDKFIFGETLTPTERRPIAQAVMGNSASVVAHPGDDLGVLYNAALALTPSGAPRSSTNRATLVLMPGIYDHAVGTTLTFAHNYIDIVGIGATRRTPAVKLTNVVLTIASGDVHVSGIEAERINSLSPAATTLFENCKAVSHSFGSGIAYPNDATYIGCVSGSYSFGYDSGYMAVGGNFIDCVGGDYSFGCLNSAPHGNFTNCVAGSFSFGYSSNAGARGNFKNCTGGSYCFGSDMCDAEGVFEGCVAVSNAFGHSSQASGTFIRCRSGNYSFGFSSSATGKFIECVSGSSSFGAYGAGSTGVFIRCEASDGGMGMFGGIAGRVESMRLEFGPNTGPTALFGLFIDCDISITGDWVLGNAPKVSVPSPASADDNFTSVARFERCRFNRDSCDTAGGMASASPVAYLLSQGFCLIDCIEVTENFFHSALHLAKLPHGESVPLRRHELDRMTSAPVAYGGAAYY